MNVFRFLFRSGLLLLAVWVAHPLAKARPLCSFTDIFPLGEKHSHYTSIVECPNGDLLVC